MSATLLTNELTNLVSEAKRKNPELRNAAEKSLQDLKSLPTTSEQQLAADLKRRPTFIDPFLIACGTRNIKFAGSGVICLQRLVISKGLPNARLNGALDAFNACTALGLDVQLKILQALPSLLQNYAEDLKGDLLGGALQVCSSLQSAKAHTVSGVAAATLQQLVTAVFEKVTAEDRNAASVAATEEIPGDGVSVFLRPAAFDAYRVFRDLVLTAEERQTKFVQFNSLSSESSLELIWSSMSANPKLFDSHAELRSVIQSNLLPLVTRALSEKLAFSTTVRSVRLLDLLLSRYMPKFSGEMEVALGLMSQNLDFDSTPQWKRALVMEVIRNMFSNGSLVVEAYAAYDEAQGGKPVIQDLLSTFVRLSSEKPAVIGLGHQSTTPMGPASQNDTGTDQAILEAAGGMAGVISSALGVAENNVTGISPQWSVPRGACLDQLDKSDPPTMPDTYVYALVLECLGSLSDALARIVLPLTVHSEDVGFKAKDNSPGGERSTSRPSRSQSFRRRAVPRNPRETETGSSGSRIRAVASLVDRCWPAVLATSSTFLNASLEDQYYRNLIKAYQRFAQVAGLLRLSTPRDALMTTLSKSAVPPHVLNAAMADPSKSPSTESTRVFSNPKSLLSVDSLVSQASSLSDRRPPAEPARPMLTTRNLLCLRALLNLAIALGPTLEKGLAVVVSALRQADLILSAVPPQQMIRQANAAASAKGAGAESPAAVQAFSAEVVAVEAAASRLLESTADYPNISFINVIRTLCRLLSGRPSDSIVGSPRSESQSSPPPTPTLNLTKTRTLSGLPGLSTFAELRTRDYQFVVPKIGTLVALNIPRFTTNDPHESGWVLIVDELARVALNAAHPREARQAATAVLCKMAAESIADVAEEAEDLRAVVQCRALSVLLRLVQQLESEDKGLNNTDLEIQGHVVDALRSVLERCGGSLVAGWNLVLAIISSTFERTEYDGVAEQQTQDGVDREIDWTQISHDLVSVQIGRVAFAATQLVCSDFLASLPVPVVASLIELLGRFVTQTDDLNLALTTVTMAWNLSDFLFNNITTEEMNAFAISTQDFDTVEEAASGSSHESRSAQTILLLIRLCDASRHCRKDARNAVFQTICSIFHSHGEQLSPATWDVTLRVVLMRIASEDAKHYFLDDTDDATGKQEAKPETKFIDETMSKTIITGTADVIAQHIRLIEQVAKLPSLWEVFLNTMETYLDAETHILNAAVYSALSSVLYHIDKDSAVWTAPGYRTVALWLKRVPEISDEAPKGCNQDSFNAYVDAAVELYRLTRESMGTSQLRKLVDNLFLCVQQSDGPRFASDINSLSPLQAKVLVLLKGLRADLPNIPSRLIGVAAQLCTLHHDSSAAGTSHSALSSSSSKKTPSFVALASESVAWLQELVSCHLSDSEIWETGALISAIQSLRRLVTEKYNFSTAHKNLPLWRRATSAALALARPILEVPQGKKGCVYLDTETKVTLWVEYVAISGGIVAAKGLPHMAGDQEKVYEGQVFDIESFRTLQGVLIPKLGDASLPDGICDQYCRAIFNASLVHAVEKTEELRPGDAPLRDLGKIRRGRVKRVPPSERERMSYVCLEELVALSSAPTSTGPQSVPEEEFYRRKRMAQAAAPLLILRLAIPVRAYIADQTLRGKRPQPLSEVEELLYSFRKIKELRLLPGALDAIEGGEQDQKSHWRFLYSLLVKAAATAGDQWSGSEKVLQAVLDVLEGVMGIAE